MECLEIHLTACSSRLTTGHGFLGIGADADQSALNELYQSMKPDVSSMQSLIDQYRESGQAIPKSLMDGFNEAIEVGAAAGDEDAAWQELRKPDYGERK